MRRDWLAAGLVMVLAMLLPSVALASPRPPWINSSLADRPVEPTEFGPGLAAQKPRALTTTAVGNYVRRIKWSSWGGKEATGAGEVSLLRAKDGDEANPYLPEETSPVTVRLGGLRQCLGVSVYTTYSLDLANGEEAPEGWPRGQQGTFPCEVRSAFFDASPSYRSKCAYTGLEPSFGPDPRGKDFGFPEWQPHVPFKRARTWDFCELKVQNWGSPTATLTGLALALLHPDHQNRVWPARLELHHPIWCPAAATEDPYDAAPVTYGMIQLTIYGDGPNLPPGAKFPQPNFSGSRHVYRQSINPPPDECLLGIDLRNPRYRP